MTRCTKCCLQIVYTTIVSYVTLAFIMCEYVCSFGLAVVARCTRLDSCVTMMMVMNDYDDGDDDDDDDES